MVINWSDFIPNKKNPHVSKIIRPFLVGHWKHPSLYFYVLWRNLSDIHTIYLNRFRRNE